MNTINELVASSNELQDLLIKRKRLVEKWDRTGLLTKLSDTREAQYAKRGMAQLLENQAKELLRESSNDGNVGGFMNIAFPLVRRIFGPMFAQELLGVQPMSLPAGLLFFLDFTYGQTKGMFTSGGSIFGNPVGKAIAVSGTLGTGGPHLLRDSFSQRIVSCSNAYSVTGNRIDGTSGSCTGTATWAEVDYDPNLSGSTVVYLLLPTGSFTSSAGAFDTTNVTQISVSTASATHYREHNQSVYDAGGGLSYVKCFFSNFAFSSSVLASVAWVVQPTITEASGITVAQTYESDFGSTPSPQINEIDIKIQSVSVVAGTRKLMAKWTPELAQDLNAYHNLDAEIEITQILSEHITLEIDLELLDMLTQAAYNNGTKKFWSRRVGKYVDEDTGVALTGTSWYGTRVDWYQTLVETINSVGNAIHKKIKRGKANFIVTSTKIQTLLQSTNLFRASTTSDPKELSFNIGMEKAGSLDNKYNVYISPYFYDNIILIGYKGTSWLEVGAVYAPYVPIIMTPTIFAPEDFTPRRGLMTRYAKKVTNPSFYGMLVCEDLNG